MKLVRAATAVLAAVLLAACGATTPASSGTSPASAEPASTGPASSSATSMSCTEFDMTAAHLLTYVHYVSLNVGTENSSAGYFGEMKDAVSALEANAAACAPRAAAALTALVPATKSLEGTYVPGADAAAIATDKAALAAYLLVAKAAWTAMGKDATVWDTELKYSV